MVHCAGYERLLKYDCSQRSTLELCCTKSSICMILQSWTSFFVASSFTTIRLRYSVLLVLAIQRWAPANSQPKKKSISRGQKRSRVETGCCELLIIVTPWSWILGLCRLIRDHSCWGSNTGRSGPELNTCCQANESRYSITPDRQTPP